ncbi:pimeloyl-ACP methyl ester carboxylesterase [Cellulosimicrobium cellulans]|uniref:alpha/beta fold hydrolase n=1 Tax=Cellulosimicrobium cellulans TaxID=1710 RepID=UPI0027DDC9D1|nr:alpha/beta hydrolase [Cellulosimicrobium cellulans]MBM7820204.1 pimeloyl-ACP methyl ester carboxylesterase [Cellulosimicrobium cellulans]
MTEPPGRAPRPGARPAPRTSAAASPRTGLRLRERAVDYAYVAGRQVAAALHPRRPVPTGTGGRGTVVLLPGVLETWHLLAPVAEALAAAGHRVRAVPGLGHNRRPFTEGSELVAHLLEEEDLHDVVLVAHSKGGLVGKRVMLSAGGPRVAGMVAVATPFNGSSYARYVVGRTLRAFSPRDAALLALAAERGVDARITAVYPRFDPHIPETGRLEGGRNVELPLAGHFLPLGDPALVEVVVREVDRLARSTSRE